MAKKNKEKVEKNIRDTAPFIQSSAFTYTCYILLALGASFLWFGSQSYARYSYWGVFVPVLFSVLLFVFLIYLSFSQYSDRLTGKYVAVLLVFAACSYLAMVNPWLSVIGDNVVYVGLGMGLSQGKGMLTMNSYPPAHSLTFGFGLPALLVPSLWFFPENFSALKIPVAICGIMGVWFTYLLMSKVASRTIGLCICLLTAVNMYLLENMDVLAEIPYFAFSMLALYALIAFAQSDGVQRNGFFYLAVGSVSYAYHIKPVGIVLLIAGILYLGWLRQWKKLFFLTVGCLLLITPWMLRNKIVAKEFSKDDYLAYGYGKAIMATYQGVREDFPTYGKSLSENIRFGVLKSLERQSFWVTDIVCKKTGPAYLVMVMGFVIIGFLVHVYKHVPKDRNSLLPDIYMFGMFLVNLIVGTFICSRYVAILIPLFLFYFFYGIQWVLMLFFARVNTHYKKEAVVTVILIVISVISYIPNAGAMMQDIQFRRTQRGYGGAWGRYYEAVQWIGKNTPPSNVKIVCRKCEMLYVWIKRYGVVYPYSSDENKMLDFLLEHEYIIVDNGLGFNTTPQFMLPVIQKHMDRFAVVYRTGQPYQYVLKVLPATQPQSGAQ